MKRLLIICALLFTTGLGVSSASVWPVDNSATLIVAVPSQVDTLDPGTAVSVSTARILACVCETLVVCGDTPGKVLPGLATKWESHKNGKVWHFYLRDGVHFHDGTILTADHVVRSFRRMYDPKFTGNSHSAEYQLFNTLFNGSQRIIADVQTVNKNEVKFILNKPIVDFLEIMALPNMAIVLVNSDNAKTPIGTGPFTFIENRIGQRVTLKSNSNYWKCQVKTDNLVFLYIPNAENRKRELLHGNVDIAFAIAPSHVAQLKGTYSEKINLLVSGGLNYWAFIMNCSRPPFNDIRMRLALQYAFPKDEILSEFAFSRGTIATSSLSPKSWAYAILPGYNANTTKAKRLLDRISETILAKPLDIIYCKDALVTESHQDFANFIRTKLDNIGLKTEFTGLHSPEYVRRVSSGAYDAVLYLGETYNTDPDINLLSMWNRASRDYGITNISRYSSGRLQQYLDIARTTKSKNVRQALYGRALKQLHVDSAQVPLIWSLQTHAYNKKVNHIKSDRFGLFDFSESYVK